MKSFQDIKKKKKKKKKNPVLLNYKYIMFINLSYGRGKIFN